MLRINNITILIFFLIYIILTSIYKTTGITIVKYSVFLLTISMIFILLIYIKNNLQLLYKPIYNYVFLLVTLLILSLIININQTSISFTIKYIGIYVFLLTGYIINIQANSIFENKKIYSKFIIPIISIPLIIYLFETFILHINESGSIFVNRNNAVLFSIVSAYFIIIFYKKISIFYLFIYLNVIVYNTLGALLASTVAYSITYFSQLTIKKLLLSILIFLLISIGLYNILSYGEIHIFQRLQSNIKGFEILFSMNSIEEMSKISYGYMAHKIGSDDLSFLFRVKHWFDIIHAHNTGDFIYWLFGHGNDSIIALTKAELRAHNDYIRLLFEVGIFYLITFILFNIYLLKQIGLNKYSLPFLIVLMYFFTENLIDNFLAMSLLYYFIGLIIALKQKGELI